MKNIKNLLNDTYDNHILPFFWVHGEKKEVIENRIQTIYDAGIGAFCVESRTHPDFLGDGWWRDIDIMIQKAKELNMKIWFFDDSHFPTGVAGGRIKTEYPQYLKRTLDKRYIDAIGPLEGASFFINDQLNDDETLVSVVVAKRSGNSQAIDEELIDVTDQVKDGVLYWDVPKGYWRVFVFVNTGKLEACFYHLNPIIPKAVDVLLETVHEQHYQKYKHEFGKTIAGFFSDESRFGNSKDFNAIIGKSDMVLPWKDGMLQELSKAFGEDFSKYLPFLWFGEGEMPRKIRYTYMDYFSKQYAKHFCDKIGNWCREHGVEYIGHVMEDAGVHTRLGWGVGHFFRAMWGQDMAGIDVVLQQIVPGYDTVNYNFGEIRERDADFYHFGLAKLGSSLGRIDPKKKGRTVCEIFGAYGWYEGLKLMKWLTDHMLVRGVNYFIPHAFTGKEGIDPDCPPHFYADGNNPQYRYFKLLNLYMNRLSYLLSDGVPIVSAAVLYHAEAEWSGECMPFEQVTKKLMQHQIDCDIVPCEVLASHQTVNEQLTINTQTYQCLIIPYAQALPNDALEAIKRHMNQGLKVFFINALPETVSDGGEIKRYQAAFNKATNCQTIDLEQIVQQLKQDDIYDIKTSEKQSYLRSYHYQKEDLNLYMFFNEHPYEKITTDITLFSQGNVYEYDAFDNKIFRKKHQKNDKEINVKIALDCYQSTVLMVGCVGDAYLCDTVDKNNRQNDKSITLDGKWKLSIAEPKQYPNFTFKKKIKQLENLSNPKHFPREVGTFRYEMTFNWEGEFVPKTINLGKVYEIAEVWINDVKVGTKICPPYTYNVENNIRVGDNIIRIDVTNTLVKQIHDCFSIKAMQEPTGLMGPVVIN